MKGKNILKNSKIKLQNHNLQLQNGKLVLEGLACATSIASMIMDMVLACREKPGINANDMVQVCSEKPNFSANDSNMTKISDLEKRLEELAKELDEAQNLDEKKRLEEQVKREEEARRQAEELENQRKDRREKLGIDNENDYNFAIAGRSGVGKSSLVNALRGIKPNEAGAAKVDELECTQQITCYRHPKAGRIVFWDLPGAGTEGHPIDGYYEDKVLHAFDAILLVVNERFYAVDFQLAKKAYEAKKSVAFLLSKADVHVMNRANREGCTMKEASKLYLMDVRGCFGRECESHGLNDVPLFVVSSNAFLKKSAYMRIIDNDDDDPDTDKTLAKEGIDEKTVITFLIASAARRISDMKQLENLMTA